MRCPKLMFAGLAAVVLLSGVRKEMVAVKPILITVFGIIAWAVLVVGCRTDSPHVEETKSAVLDPPEWMYGTWQVCGLDDVPNMRWTFASNKVIYDHGDGSVDFNDLMTTGRITDQVGQEGIFHFTFEGVDRRRNDHLFSERTDNGERRMMWSQDMYQVSADVHTYHLCPVYAE